ncbi:RNA-directed DNA polymerase [Elizabethkingia anophelis]|nr:RNA-directed DNA polymerase [Elizabethkingia anophelis]MCT4277080.1 RNA-directed DNA polymerase [Elizabethkingia anophelis]MCT4280493.1 RNA-directed DNA polymerase [Elizabethkingia anophelis]
MLDQSFSYDNFRILLDVENRRGKYLQDKDIFDNADDYFLESRRLTEEIIKLNREIRDSQKALSLTSSPTDDEYKQHQELLDEKESIKEEREKKLEEALTKISLIANDDNFKLVIRKGIVKFDDQLYVTDNTVENYLVLKQLQRNIYKTFSVKQADRKLIISQIKLLLNENFPKIIVRTDISKFYESIPHKQLISKIEENSLLNNSSKRIIKSILNQYWNLLLTDGVKNLGDERIGVPRGIGISAFLSELYLKDIDNIIKSIPNVIYYSRYVDDIIIIFSPPHRNEKKTTDQYRKQIEKVVNKFHLEMNSSKTKVFDLRKANSDRKTSIKYEITFLGYKFIREFKKEKKQQAQDVIIPKKLVVSMSDSKLNRFKSKISYAFNEFDTNIIKYSGQERGTNKLLIQRIKVLTNNFRLYRRKNNVLIGIYFSNEFLTEDLSDLKDLDLFLKSEINRLSIKLSPKTRLALEELSFVEGFKSKKTLNFNFNDKLLRGSVNIDKILNIWHNL